MTEVRIRGALGAAEDLAAALGLGAMVLLPLVEAVLRAGLGVGIVGAASLEQHLVLFVGMLGGLLAAREGRLLALATAAFLPGQGLKAAARAVSAGAGAGVAVLLGLAGAAFVAGEMEAGARLFRGVPAWTVQLVLPAGFGLLALRLLAGAPGAWRGRGVAALAAGGVLLLWFAGEPGAAAAPALLGLALLAALGLPIFAVLGGAAMVLFAGQGIPAATVAVDHYQLVTNPSLPALPLFTLAGCFLAEGGASRRLVRVFQALVGSWRGGPALVTALACAFFTAFTGASGVTILALGGLLMPVLLQARMSERSALGLLTGAGSLGLLFPPCLPLILYAIVAQVPLERLFLGGLLPGLLLLALTALWGRWRSPRPDKREAHFNPAEAARALWAAKFELLLPVVALAALLGGYATPVEAAALTALYAFFVEVVVHRDLGLVRDVPRVLAGAALLVGGVLLIFGVALGLTDALVLAQLPEQAVEWVQASVSSPYVFLLLLNLFLLAVGCLMDIFSAIVVVAPLVVPLGQAFGVHPVHLGILFLANLELGYLTPPVGMNLFLASYRFGKPVGQVCRAVLPLLLVLLAGVLAIAYFPPLTLVLPGLLGPGP